MKEIIKAAITRTKAYLCLECGKCTANCPIALRRPEFTPRSLVEHIIKRADELAISNFLWTCLTCKMCEERCPSDVKFIDLIRSVRGASYQAGQTPECPHGGTLHSLMRLMAESDKPQERLQWLSSGLKVEVVVNPSPSPLPTGERNKVRGKEKTGYFVGCAPYFDEVFRELGCRPTETALSTIKLLNKVGIQPAILADERCCGHDLLWIGDTESFKKLAARNIESIRQSGIEKLIFSCPECYRTFKIDYPEPVSVILNSEPRREKSLTAL